MNTSELLILLLTLSWVAAYWYFAYKICKKYQKINSIWEMLITKNLESNKLLWAIILGKSSINHIPKDFNFYFVKYGAFATIPIIISLKIIIN